MKRLLVLLSIITVFACNNDSSSNSMYSLLISKEGKMVRESYFNGKHKDDLFNVQSITKSIISLLIGVAIEQELIAGEETLISNYFTDISFDSDRKKNITIGHLLNHTSGLEWNGYLEHQEFLNSLNPASYVLDRRMEAEPGEVYNYNSGGTHLLSIILSKASGMSTIEFAKEHLLNPLGCQDVKWNELKDGYHDGSGLGLSMHARDLVKVGELMLNEGSLNNSQLVSKRWISKSFDHSLKRDTQWGLRKSKHGYGWYSKMNGNEQILYSMGYGGQFIFIVPKKDLVLVTTHNHDTPYGLEQQIDFVSETFPSLLQGYGD